MAVSVFKISLIFLLASINCSSVTGKITPIFNLNSAFTKAFVAS
jgi:hypothetical protein